MNWGFLQRLVQNNIQLVAKILRWFQPTTSYVDLHVEPWTRRAIAAEADDSPAKLSPPSLTKISQERVAWAEENVWTIEVVWHK